MKTIRVTREHIDEGSQNDCRNCPIAKAVSEAMFLDNYDWKGSVSVAERIWINWALPSTYRLVLDHTDESWQFMKDFDAGNPVKPFEFDLDIE